MCGLLHAFFIVGARGKLETNEEKNSTNGKLIGEETFLHFVGNNACD